ncbi:monovalent cation/H(+) antiporter subunit G [Pedobacter antarcticus]|uniref:Multisubunit sodium/proton antiporter, MrpG subunit n=3 Tax=Pedobacter antarcticus TaxID=34086 RepID=A0A1I2GVC5_9SPHI|nr:monovalent cation/H(+) antiporter subunit G [Pedobacter antarcticus]SDM27613.1 multisubunit sodium/proton antiporter, MrpG subunit [Pedobacter antarcticus]SFF20777.1 multisubunit sodium/proton antiporter, MrpG subunit [Pedobacter antarcticus]
MSDILIMAGSTLGTLFILIASIGILRMPDFYLRLSVTIKAATLGVGLVLGSAAVYFSETAVTTKLLAIILFLLLTAPVAAHMIGRAAHFTGNKRWKHTLFDDLEGKYNDVTHELSSEATEEKDKNV